MVPHSRQIFDSASADHYNRMLLQIMTFSRNVSRYFNTVCEPDSRDLSKSRIWLLRSRCVYSRADSSFLRTAFHRRSISLLDNPLSSESDQLVNCRQLLPRSMSYCSNTDIHNKFQATIVKCFLQSAPSLGCQTRQPVSPVGGS